MARMRQRQVMSCYWCDHDATTWIDWCVHEIPGDYGGGKLMSFIPLCTDHKEMIDGTLAEIESL